MAEGGSGQVWRVGAGVSNVLLSAGQSGPPLSHPLCRLSLGTGLRCRLLLSARLRVTLRRHIRGD